MTDPAAIERAISVDDDLRKADAAAAHDTTFETDPAHSDEDDEEATTVVASGAGGHREKDDDTDDSSSEASSDSGAARSPGRRRLITALALLPFLGCSAALAAYMVATLGGAPAPGGDGAAADLTGAAPPVATARAPSYAPTLMVPATGWTPAPVGWEEPAGGDDGHPLGHLRATAAPSASPAATRTTTPAPSAVCARAGVPCPKDKHDCCSGRCEKDEETKEKVCSAEPMTTAAPYASPTAEPSMAPAAEPRTNDPTDDGVPGASLPTDAPVSSSPTVAPAMLTGAPTDACVEAGAPCPADKKDCCSGICTKDKETKEKVCWGTPPPATSPPTAAPSTAAPTVCEAAGAPCPKDKARCCSGGCEKDEETGEKVCGGAAGPGPGPEDRCLVAGEACADKKMCCSGSCKKAKKDNKDKGRARLLKEKVCE